MLRRIGSLGRERSSRYGAILRRRRAPLARLGRPKNCSAATGNPDPTSTSWPTASKRQERRKSRGCAKSLTDGRCTSRNPRPTMKEKTMPGDDKPQPVGIRRKIRPIILHRFQQGTGDDLTARSPSARRSGKTRRAERTRTSPSPCSRSPRRPSVPASARVRSVGVGQADRVAVRNLRASRAALGDELNRGFRRRGENHVEPAMQKRHEQNHAERNFEQD